MLSRVDDREGGGGGTGGFVPNGGGEVAEASLFSVSNLATSASRSTLRSVTNERTGVWREETNSVSSV